MVGYEGCFIFSVCVYLSFRRFSMKSYINLFTEICLALAVIFFSSCDAGEEVVSPNEKEPKKL